MKLDVTTEQTPPRLAIPVNEKDHTQGPPDAPVTLVEYGDFECPYCGKAHPIVKRIIEQMGDRLRFVFRNFPLNTIHAHAGVAAQAAEAAAAQGRITLDQMVIQQLPEMLRAAAQGLEGANVTVLNGAEGLNSVVASLAAQGMALLEAVRNGIGPATAEIEDRPAR